MLPGWCWGKNGCLAAQQVLTEWLKLVQSPGSGPLSRGLMTLFRMPRIAEFQLIHIDQTHKILMLKTGANEFIYTAKYNYQRFALIYLLVLFRPSINNS